MSIPSIRIIAPDFGDSCLTSSSRLQLLRFVLSDNFCLLLDLFFSRGGSCWPEELKVPTSNKLIVSRRRMLWQEMLQNANNSGYKRVLPSCHFKA
jgi:hypothetical protein